jgi:triosephosphate isomerase
MMPGRRPHVGGNWKMNLLGDEAEALVAALTVSLAKIQSVDVAIFPAFTYLAGVGQLLATAAGSASIRLGAQDCYMQPKGAFTGEVSMAMLQDVGVSIVLAGHSERRHVLGETDVMVNAKVRAALDAGLDVVLCVGETLEQREARQTDSINAAQICYGLAGVADEQMQRVTIAYEPVWAIGTGKTATPQDAQDAHVSIRKMLAGLYGTPVAQTTRIQYGGSVNPGNATQLFAQPDIDGGLIGGAALKAEDFAAIVTAAAG